MRINNFQKKHVGKIQRSYIFGVKYIFNMYIFTFLSIFVATHLWSDFQVPTIKDYRRSFDMGPLEKTQQESLLEEAGTPPQKKRFKLWDRFAKKAYTPLEV